MAAFKAVVVVDAMMMSAYRSPCRIRMTLGLLSMVVLLLPTNAFTPSPLKNHPISRHHSRHHHWTAAAATTSTAQSNRNNNSTSYFISPDQIDKLQQSVDLCAVIESQGLKQFTRKSGAQGAVALCPFHDDKTPSLHIDNNRKIYKCFSCGEGGNVFNFVRAYAKVKDEPELSFYSAVRKVAQEYGQNTAVGKEILALSSKKVSPQQLKKRQERAAKRKRLELCNAAAAAYFGDSLIYLPQAGSARSWLLDRGLSPETVRAFALGFAPDNWSGLVEHLQDANYTAQEIFDSGLATKRRSVYDQRDESKNSLQHDQLIDRFRGRVMVPIFDASGERVIAFGGRILPALEVPQENSSFVPPKYLNSPETAIFSKSNELFGIQTARDAITEQREENPQATPTIVMVEGYMDAIALYEAGIRQAVASMGTAVTMEQLSHAAKAVGGGKLLLALDNDEAGIMAVERLCNSQFLIKLAESHIVQVAVATLPKNIKDPAEYFENKCGSEDDFRRDVLDASKEWSAWYTQLLLSRYNSTALTGAPGSFADVCERVSDFLTTFPNPADRTQRAYRVASKLANLLSSESDSDKSSSSAALQIQLESDLVGMVSRKAAAKQAMEHRVEQMQGYDAQNTSATMKRLVDGGHAVGSDLLSRKALQEVPKAASKVVSNRRQSKPKISPTVRPFSKGSVPSKATRGNKMKHKAFTRPPLTPHFNGMDSMSATDAAWLGIPQDKSKRKMGHLTLGDDAMKRKKGNLVYFNSNEFHGDQYLTEAAMNAGYEKGEVIRDTSVFDKGISVLVQEDQEKKALAAEERMLRILVRYETARSAMIAAVSSNDATGARPEIVWSSLEREWLFEFLVFRSDVIPPKVLDEPERLWEFLASQDDTPGGAFGSNPFGRPALPVKFVEESDGATSVEAVTLQSDESQTESISVSHEDVEDMAASYDPAMFDSSPGDPVETSVTNDELKEESLESIDVSAEVSPLEVIDVDAVVDARLEPGDSRTGTLAIANSPKQQPPNTAMGGSLDSLFVFHMDPFEYTYDESVERSFRAELEVQEALAYLLRSCAAKKLANVNYNWQLASQLLDARLGLQGTDAADLMSGVKELDSMNVGDLQLYCKTLLTRLQQLSDTVQQLNESAKRISTRLMDYSAGDNTEGKISLSKQREVALLIDEHVDSLPEDYQPKDVVELMDPNYVLSLFDQGDGRRNNGDDDGDDYKSPRELLSRGPPPSEEYDPESEAEKFQEDMHEMDRYWGEMSDEDYVWSIPDENDVSSRPRTDPNNDSLYGQYADDGPDDMESVQRVLDRIDEEWGEWESETTPWEMKSKEQPTVNLQDLLATDEKEHDSSDDVGIAVDTEPSSEWE